jgi:hypothetical protein
VIASDIPVHREVAGGWATYLHPLDGPGWAGAVERIARAAPDGLKPGYAPPVWDEHFAIVNHVLTGL